LAEALHNVTGEFADLISYNGRWNQNLGDDLIEQRLGHSIGSLVSQWY